MEAMVSEAAAAAGVDPIEYRIRHTTNQRLIDVLQRLKTEHGWQTRPSPSPKARATGSGVVSGQGVGVMAHPGASVKIVFTKAGVYKFKTRFGEDYMKMPDTIGEDNSLILTVVVSRECVSARGTAESGMCTVVGTTLSSSATSIITGWGRLGAP